MGRHLKKIADGFSGTEKGDWTIYKMFYERADGAEGEFYLNINERTGVANIAAKDIGYADVLINAFTDSMTLDSDTLDREYNDPELNDMEDQSQK